MKIGIFRKKEPAGSFFQISAIFEACKPCETKQLAPHLKTAKSQLTLFSQDPQESGGI